MGDGGDGFGVRKEGVVFKGGGEALSLVLLVGGFWVFLVHFSWSSGRLYIPSSHTPCNPAQKPDTPNQRGTGFDIANRRKSPGTRGRALWYLLVWSRAGLRGSLFDHISQPSGLRETFGRQVACVETWDDGMREKVNARHLLPSTSMKRLWTRGSLGVSLLIGEAILILRFGEEVRCYVSRRRAHDVGDP